MIVYIYKWLKKCRFSQDVVHSNGLGAPKRSFGAIYTLKPNILPRQARDKHRESSKKTVFPQRIPLIVAAG
jgi:hypothetical protein